MLNILSYWSWLVLVLVLSKDIWSKAWFFFFLHICCEILRNQGSRLNVSERKFWDRLFPCFMHHDCWPRNWAGFLSEMSPGHLSARSQPCTLCLKLLTENMLDWAGCPAVSNQADACFPCPGIYLFGRGWDELEGRTFISQAPNLLISPEKPSQQFFGMCWFLVNSQAVISCTRGHLSGLNGEGSREWILKLALLPKQPGWPQGYHHTLSF